MNSKKVKRGQSSDDKYLVSFYLSATTCEKIDDLLFYLKKRIPMGKRRRLTKSMFYETGFKILIEEYNSKGEESNLWKAIHQSIQN